MAELKNGLHTVYEVSRLVKPGVDSGRWEDATRVWAATLTNRDEAERVERVVNERWSRHMTEPNGWWCGPFSRKIIVVDGEAYFGLGGMHGDSTVSVPSSLVTETRDEAIALGVGLLIGSTEVSFIRNLDRDQEVREFVPVSEIPISVGEIAISEHFSQALV